MGKHATALLLTATAFVGSAAAASAQVAADGAPNLAAAPVVSGISCRAACAGLERGGAGSTVRLTGRGLAGATGVMFLGGRGPKDDVGVRVPAAPDDASLDVVVPARARSGPLRVVGATGVLSKATTQRLVVGAKPPTGAPLVQAHVDAKRVFLDGHSQPSVSFFLGGREPTSVRVDLLRDGDPAPVASWTPPPMPAGSVQTISWDGALAPIAPPEGRYVFQITALSGGVLAAAQSRAQSRAATSAQTADPLAPVSSGFMLLGHAFPVQGPHTIGMDPSQRFGAGRDGHIHEGQDVLAACGTPLVAVGSGVIRYRATQAAAGNYVVLRTDGDNTDYAYMHLRDPALVDRGTRVATGQLLGYVGDTGDAEGCHLHFEKWPAPGWYTGGAPVDPLADLQAWDTTS